MTKLYDDLLVTGLPVTFADGDRMTFSRPLNMAEIKIATDIQYPPTYDVLRVREYPPLSDLADAIYWQENGDKKPMEAYLAAVSAVKVKYPKPE